MNDFWGETISSYSRAQGIEDGFLIDLSGQFPNDTRIYKYPVACTSAVWALIERAGGEPGAWVWDVCVMAAKFPTHILDECSRLFRVTIGREAHTLKVVCGPGDDAEPVITIMCRNED